MNLHELLHLAHNRSSTRRSILLSRRTTLSKEQKRWIQDQLKASARTFAIVIRLLPKPLAWWISLCYLIIRGMDDIEDGSGYQPGTQRLLLEEYLSALQGRKDPHSVVKHCYTAGTPDGDTYRQLPNQAKLLAKFPIQTRILILQHCKRIGHGMADWAERKWTINTTEDLSAYCYVVAGIPGELMIDLFCEHTPTLRPLRSHLRKLAVQLWEVLQISNIVRDMRSDLQRGICFVPSSMLVEAGLPSSAELFQPAYNQGTQFVIEKMIEQTHSSMAGAIELVLSLPVRHFGMRLFCSVPLALAIATLQLCRHRLVRSTERVKLTKWQMWKLVLCTILGSASNTWVMKQYESLK